MRLLIIGAHPDDADLGAGGLAALYRAAGHAVRMVSLTDGSAGHHLETGPVLAQRRRLEALAAGAVIGAEYLVLDQPDGGLLPTLENRALVIRLIRGFQPDLILTHRPNDYHPDHRACGQLVQDAAYMVTVPAIVPDAPHLAENPLIGYLADDFRKPCPFEPAIAIDVGPVVDLVAAMLDCHASQFYEWLPANQGKLAEVPPGEAERRAWLLEWIRSRLRLRADFCRELLIDLHGAERGRSIEFAEAFEPCEHGGLWTREARGLLFGFLIRR